MAGEGGLARKVRTGLDEETPSKNTNNVIPMRPADKNGTRDPLDEKWFGKTIRQHVREFACVFAIISLIVAGMMLYKGRPLLWPGVWTGVALVLVALGYGAPALLHPLWKGWMKVAHYLSVVMTFIIIGAAWTIVLMPISMLLRVLRIKVMDTTYKKPVASYWEDRDAKYHDFKLLERQF